MRDIDGKLGSSYQNSVEVGGIAGWAQFASVRVAGGPVKLIPVDSGRYSGSFGHIPVPRSYFT